MAFENQIKHWVSIDNQIKILNDRLKSLRTERNTAGSQILDYVETENLTNATVQISDGKLRFMETRQTAPLTLKHVSECLSTCIPDQDKVNNIMRYIKDSRETRVISDIKRTYIN